MRSRLGPWQALIGFAVTWVIVEALFELAIKWFLERLQLPSVRGRAAVGAAFGSAVLCALVLARFSYSGYPGHPDLSAVIATTLSSVVLCAVFAVIYVIGRRSLGPAIAAHAAIDMVVEPGLMLLAAMGGVVR
jgi:membrane protease YdiL (CAAX protease family)